MVDCSTNLNSSDSPKVSDRKQAVIAGTFLIYLIYNAAVLLAYLKKDAEVSIHIVETFLINKGICRYSLISLTLFLASQDNFNNKLVFSISEIYESF